MSKSRFIFCEQLIFLPSPLFQLSPRDDAFGVWGFHELTELKHATESRELFCLGMHKVYWLPQLVAMLRRQPICTRAAEEASCEFRLGVTGIAKAHTGHLLGYNTHKYKVSMIRHIQLRYRSAPGFGAPRTTQCLLVLDCLQQTIIIVNKTFV